MPGNSICHPTIAEVLSTSWIAFVFVFVVGVFLGSAIQARIYRRAGAVPRWPFICRVCHATANVGGFEQCPSCGAHQDPQTLRNLRGGRDA